MLIPLNIQVVCSQVNCGNTTSPTSPRFGVGTGPILMTNVQCQPGDDCIEHCPHLTSTTGCTHSRDVSVTCGGIAFMLLLLAF